MAGYKRYIGTGLIVGAAAAAAYLASRRLADTVPGLIDWQRVRAVALKSCRNGVGEMTAADRVSLAARYAARVRRSEDLIGRYIGRVLPQQLEHVHVFDRSEWIDANIANFQMLFAPLERMNSGVLSGTSAGSRLVGGFSQLFMSTQLGILLGYLAQRVLGQYDLAVLGHEPLTSGRLYFVEPNIAALEGRLNVDGEDFRLWIALHETTHAYEFEANPWLRGHMNDLIRRYFETVSREFMSFRADRHALAGMIWRIASNVLDSQYAVEWVMSPAQRALFRRMQALMCLLEGYSNHVMGKVGAELFPRYEEMKARFEERSKDRPPVEKLFTKLIGLDIKYEQYVLGERFVGGVVNARGIDFMNKVWDAEDNLPALDEVKEPRRWIQRVSGAPQLMV